MSDELAVRFYPYLVHGVHHRAVKKVAFCKHGPMDSNSVKNCATVTLMRQKQDNILSRCGSQLAWEATRWTGYASAIWSFRLANHILHYRLIQAERLLHQRRASTVYLLLTPRDRSLLSALLHAFPYCAWYVVVKKDR